MCKYKFPFDSSDNQPKVDFKLINTLVFDIQGKFTQLLGADLVSFITKIRGNISKLNTCGQQAQHAEGTYTFSHFTLGPKR